MCLHKMVRRAILAVLLFSPLIAFAHIMQITPISPFPSAVSAFSTPMTASYLVANVSRSVKFTAIDRSQFPAGSGLSISSSTCGNVLTPGQSCKITLTLEAMSPLTITTYLREWAKPTADGMQYPINVQVTTMESGLLFAGAANGNVYLSANNGAGWTPTVNPPNPGNAVNCIFATNQYLYACSGNTIYYSTSGKVWTAAPSPDGSTVTSLFITPSSLIIVGTSNGAVLSSADNGTTWVLLSEPDFTAVDSVFVSSSGIWYAGTSDGNVYYSLNNGISWTAYSSKPDGSSAITAIYEANNTLYVGTFNEFVYTNTSLNGGGTWDFYAQTAYRLFINSSGSVMDVETQGGYVYSLVNGNLLGFITNSPINGIFQLS